MMVRNPPTLNSVCYVISSKLSNAGTRDRNRTGTPAMNEAADFKSAVSTYFTTRAKQCWHTDCQTKTPLERGSTPIFHNLVRTLERLLGGAARSRTGLAGFAIRYITALLPRHVFFTRKTQSIYKSSHTHCLTVPIKKDSILKCCPFNLEREKSLELSTSTLARLRSTN